MDKEAYLEKMADQRRRRKANGNAYTKKYEKTLNGFLVRKYRNMKSRVTGIQHKKAHLYKGKELLNKEAFYAWSKRSKKLKLLWAAWLKSNYDRRLCPTVDRIDSSLGYTIDNMQWITHAENSAKITRNKV
jgi:hypothetical protein